MRILLALGIGILLLGGTWLYTWLSALAIAEVSQATPSFVEEAYSVEVLRTFTAIAVTESRNGTDADTSKNRIPTQSAAIRVLFKGQPVLTREEKTAPEIPCVIDRLEGVERGRNEVFVCARLEPPKPGELAALHVRIRSRDRVVAEETFASLENSPLIYGTVAFDAASSPKETP